MTESDSRADTLAPVIPLFAVTRGEPTPEELGALVAVLAARGTAGGAPEPEPAARWASRERALRRPLHPGPDAWAWSAR